MMARSRSGSVAVTPSSAPREPSPDTLDASLVATSVLSEERANWTAASLSPRKSREPSDTFEPSTPSGITYRFMRSNWMSGLSMARLVAAKWTAESCTS